jgi:UDP-2,4-diacetamido-2,4,6-trideoxy-beta-L-altropyranose hydrolase
MRIGFRLDLGPVTGIGHFSRCMSIAKTMVHFGHEVTFLVNGLDQRARGLLSKSGIEYLALNKATVEVGYPGILGAQDAELTKNLAHSLAIELLVVDHYGADRAWLEIFRDRSFRLMGICDYPADPIYDIVLDYGFDATISKHNRDDEDRLYLIGPEYSPIGGTLDEAPVFGEDSLQQSDLLMALGSGIPDSIIIDLAECHISRGSDFRLRIVSAREVSNFPVSSSAELIIAPESISPYWSKVSYSVTGGGLTMYERIANGVPGLAIESAQNQSMSLVAAESKGITKRIGFDELRNPNEFLKSIEGFMKGTSGPEEKLRLQSIVDLNGPTRICFELGLLTSGHHLDPVARKVKMSDANTLLRWANDEATRINSFGRDPISPKNHITWMRKTIEQAPLFLMFETFGIPLGYVRINNESGSNLLSYGLDKIFRGKGIATGMLKIALEQAPDIGSVLAIVALKNTPSLRALAKAGFQNLDIIEGNQRLFLERE